MIAVAAEAVQAVRNADRPHDLHHWLREAMRLEHSTVPLYLAAYFSIKPGANAEVGAILRSIVIEEMMHFAVVANVLNAVGGQAMIDDAHTVPHFPGPLPMGVEAGLSLSVRPLSHAQCAAFMEIEEPDDPIGLPPVTPDPVTIGDFYHAIIDKIGEWGDAAFGQPGAPQVVSPAYPSDQLFAVTDAASAVRALTVVVEQGEGTLKRPTIGRGESELAHYYRFGEIVNRKRFVLDPAAAEGYSYSGDPVGLDESAVYPMIDDATLDLYRGRPDPAGLHLATAFCTAYRHLLACLQETFTGSPAALRRAFGIMYELRIAALAMLQTTDPDDPTHVLTPPWEYLPAPAPTH